MLPENINVAQNDKQLKLSVINISDNMMIKLQSHSYYVNEDTYKKRNAPQTT